VDCPPARGSRLQNDTICVEVRDRGLAWRDDTGARRGEELVVWSVLDATNYKYIIEWTFRDDGALLGRVGATGRNLTGHHDVSHAVTWRLDIDLDGPGGDSVKLGKHREPDGSRTARDTESTVTREKGLVWGARNFTTLNVYAAALSNAQGKPSSYRVVASPPATPRLVEPYTQYDFWVTRMPGDKAAELWAPNLPSYIAPAQPVTETDVVVWYTTAFHHIERDEDDLGATQVKWIAFTLQPHDLFAAAPLYP
jgi:Cu2+-containing amine oxidase